MLAALSCFTTWENGAIQASSIDKRRAIWNEFAKQLGEIEEAMKQEPWHLYASSILFMFFLLLIFSVIYYNFFSYESAKIENPTPPRAVMIDFAHSTLHPVIDKGYV